MAGSTLALFLSSRWGNFTIDPCDVLFGIFIFTPKSFLRTTPKSPLPKRKVAVRCRGMAANKVTAVHEAGDIQLQLEPSVWAALLQCSEATTLYRPCTRPAYFQKLRSGARL
jgi:hypothetical protein